MAEKRTLRALDGNVKLACDLCSFACLFPAEARYMGEGRFYCFRHSDTETSDQRTRRENSERAVVLGKKDEMSIPIPGGKTPVGY